MNIEENDLTEQTIRAVWAIAGGTGVVALMAILNRLSINDDRGHFDRIQGYNRERLAELSRENREMRRTLEAEKRERRELEQSYKEVNRRIDELILRK